MDSPLFFHTYTFPSDPILFILVSSVHKTLFQSSNVQFSCHFANSSCFWQWVFFNMGTFFFVADWKPLSWSALLTVCGWTGCRRVELMKWVASTAVSSFPDWIWWIMDVLSQVESLEGHPPWLFSFSVSTSFLILPTVDFPRPVLLSISLTEYPCSSKERTEAWFAAEVGFMVIVRDQVEFQHVKLIQIESHDLVYSSHSQIPYRFWLQKWQNL